MKFVANVAVSHRSAASFNMPKGRSRRSSLAFGTKPGNPNELIILLQSCQNTMGTMYKVKGNVERVFDKYAKDGKMTIRFKEPPHDLIIKCEASLMEQFIKALKMGLNKNVPIKCMKLPVVSIKPLISIPEKPKEHLIYTSDEEYPVSEGFPRSAVSIMIIGLEKTRFDMRILGLPRLQILDLTDNQLTQIPPEVDLLPKLKILVLANNRLGSNQDPSAWSWLRGQRLARQLEELDLSKNEMSFLPPAVCHLRALETLKIRKNRLEKLPGAFGTMKSLKYVVASDNKLANLPGSIFQLKLRFLDVTENDYAHITLDPAAKSCRVPSLREYAARQVVRSRVPYAPEDLPAELQMYLDTVQFCWCRGPCFESGPWAFRLLNLDSITENLVHPAHNLSAIPIAFRICSPQCAKLTIINY